MERTLLTTGALSFLMESAYQGHKRLETPMLNVSYKAPKQSFYANGEGLLMALEKLVGTSPEDRQNCRRAFPSRKALSSAGSDICFSPIFRRIGS